MLLEVCDKPWSKAYPLGGGEALSDLKSKNCSVRLAVFDDLLTVLLMNLTLFFVI
jgi:hypothetical protein